MKITKAEKKIIKDNRNYKKHLFLASKENIKKCKHKWSKEKVEYDGAVGYYGEEIVCLKCGVWKDDKQETGYIKNGKLRP